MGHFSEGSRPITEEVVVVGVGSVNHCRLHYHFPNTTITWVSSPMLSCTQCNGAVLHEGADDTNVLRLKSEVSGGGGGTQRILCMEGKIDKH